jgi:hypothetical protein
MLVIVLGFPLIDPYATVRIARWTGVPVYAWFGLAALAGLYLLRNERTAFRANTVAAMHGEQPLCAVSSTRRKCCGNALLLPGPERRHGARAARAALNLGHEYDRRGFRRPSRPPQVDRRRVPPPD